jgi:hypothetical protein
MKNQINTPGPESQTLSNWPLLAINYFIGVTIRRVGKNDLLVYSSLEKLFEFPDYCPSILQLFSHEHFLLENLLHNPWRLLKYAVTGLVLLGISKAEKFLQMDDIKDSLKDSIL